MSENAGSKVERNSVTQDSGRNPKHHCEIQAKAHGDASEKGANEAWQLMTGKETRRLVGNVVQPGLGEVLALEPGDIVKAAQETQMLTTAFVSGGFKEICHNPWQSAKTAAWGMTGAAVLGAAAAIEAPFVAVGLLGLGAVCTTKYVWDTFNTVDQKNKTRNQNLQTAMDSLWKHGDNKTYASSFAKCESALAADSAGLMLSLPAFAVGFGTGKLVNQFRPSVVSEVRPAVVSDVKPPVVTAVKPPVVTEVKPPVVTEPHCAHGVCDLGGWKPGERPATPQSKNLSAMDREEANALSKLKGAEAVSKLQELDLKLGDTVLLVDGATNAQAFAVKLERAGVKVDRVHGISSIVGDTVIGTIKSQKIGQAISMPMQDVKLVITGENLESSGMGALDIVGALKKKGVPCISVAQSEQPEAVMQGAHAGMFREDLAQALAETLAPLREAGSTLNNPARGLDRRFPVQPSGEEPNWANFGRLKGSSPLPASRVIDAGDDDALGRTVEVLRSVLNSVLDGDRRTILLVQENSQEAADACRALADLDQEFVRISGITGRNGRMLNVLDADGKPCSLDVSTIGTAFVDGLLGRNRSLPAVGVVKELNGADVPSIIGIAGKSNAALNRSMVKNGANAGLPGDYLWSALMQLKELTQLKQAS